MDHTMMVVASTGLTDTMTDRESEWSPCLASGTIGSSEACTSVAIRVLIGPIDLAPFLA